MKFRTGIVGLLLLTVGLSHWLTPTEQPLFYVVHVTMRKMFLLPIILSAIWFGARGALLTALLATAVYVPHILIQWQVRGAEYLNQASDLAVLWTVAIVSGWLVDQERSASQQASRIHRGALQALVAALDAREHDTGCHSQRVREYALRLGRELGLATGDMHVLTQAALLHDVGKIGVPDRILQKPGPLDDDETRAMRRHPEIGYRILRPVPLLEEIAAAVYAHHERFDGTGYPKGLSGESAPLTSRIFSVADAFDALTSDRPYRGAVSVGQAREIIRGERGRQFDPVVVDAFLGISEGEWVQIRNSVEDAAAHVEPQAGHTSLE